MLGIVYLLILCISALIFSLFYMFLRKLSSDSMDGLVIGANLENDDMNYIVPALSLETAAREAALADGLIDNGMRGSIKSKKIGLRRGKWTLEEETYANKLIAEFKQGTLPLTDGTTLRTFLSKLLNCDPMRISKKFVGAKCIGKVSLDLSLLKFICNALFSKYFEEETMISKDLTIK